MPAQQDRHDRQDRQDRVALLPTLFECHRPVEQYARLPGPVRDAVGSAAVRVSPLDAFLMHQLVSFLPGRPQVIDLAADDTAGASTVLWASHPGVRKVVAPPRRGAEGTHWRQSFPGAMREMDVDDARVSLAAALFDGPAGWDALASSLEPLAPVVVLTAPSGDLRAVVAAAPEATVLVMPLGRTGADPALAPLLGFCAESGHTLTALRDLAPFFHTSDVAVVRRAGRAEVDAALDRVRRLYEGNFQFLDMARALVESARRERESAEDGTAGPFRDRAAQSGKIPQRAYRQAVERIRRLVADKVPADRTVVVISRGDDDLLNLGGRRAWHFPRTPEGVYAGHYPADSAAAVEHLESLREKGADVLVVPVTAFWWLRHYAGFARHLEENCELIARDDNACAVYALRGPAARAAKRAESAATEKSPAPADGIFTALRRFFGAKSNGTH